MRFVDLPGYGYARVPIEEQARWKRLIESYLLGRESLALSFLLIDARRGWMDMDLELKSWLEFHNRRYQVVVTKVDKLKSNNQLKAGLAAIQHELHGSTASAVLGHRRPGSEGNLANHLDDQEQAVAPAAATEGKPSEKPQEQQTSDPRQSEPNGNSQTTVSVAAPPVEAKPTEAKQTEPKAERPALHRNKPLVEGKTGNGARQSEAGRKVQAEAKSAAVSPERTAAPAVPSADAREVQPQPAPSAQAPPPTAAPAQTPPPQQQGHAPASLGPAAWPPFDR